MSVPSTYVLCLCKEKTNITLAAVAARDKVSKFECDDQLSKLPTKKLSRMFRKLTLKYYTYLRRADSCRAHTDIKLPAAELNI